MILDREMQRNLLIDLRRHYPSKVKLEDFLPAWATSRASQEPYVQNLYYLKEHGLVDLSGVQGLHSYHFHVHQAGITAKGLDFLEDDGGLSAILDTVTVRLHADTIRDLIEARITESEAPPEEKRRMIDALKAMPEEGLKHLTTKLIDYGLGQSPGAWQALGGLLG